MDNTESETPKDTKITVDSEGFTVEMPEDLTEEETEQRWKDVFKDLVDKGIIVPDADAPPCIDCQKKLEEITVKVILSGDPPIELMEDSFKWVPGLDQFVVSPSFFGFIKEDMGYFDARCSKCGGAVMDLEITENPHGLKFGDMTRMASKL
jgi:hypothetical protein